MPPTVGNATLRIDLVAAGPVSVIDTDRVGDFCRCPCHANPGMLHCIPCCYKCPTCGGRIAAGHTNRHALACR